MTYRLLAIMAVLILLIGIVIGLAIGYRLWHIEPSPAAETVAPAVVQSDGSHVLARVPVPPENLPAAPHKIPAGSREERRISVTVQPEQQPATDTAPACSCDPVTVDLSLIRDKTGRRVVASSPDGEVVSGSDAIVEVARVRPEVPWAVGLGVTADGRYGIRADRDFSWAPLRASLQLQQAEDGRHVDPSAWLILRF